MTVRVPTMPLLAPAHWWQNANATTGFDTEICLRQILQKCYLNDATGARILFLMTNDIN